MPRTLTPAAETEARTKHTPGPWGISTGVGLEIATLHGMPRQPTEDGLGQGWVYIKGPSAWGCAETPEEQAANAALIASAPDLLTELREAHTTLSILRTQIQMEERRGIGRWEGVPAQITTRLDAIDAAIAAAEGRS